MINEFDEEISRVVTTGDYRKVTFINPLVFDNKEDFIKKLKGFVMDNSPFIKGEYYAFDASPRYVTCKMIDYVLLFQKFNIFGNLIKEKIEGVAYYYDSKNYSHRELRDVMGAYPDFQLSDYYNIYLKQYNNYYRYDSNFIYYDQKRQFLMVNFSYLDLYFYQNNVSDALKTLKNILNLFGEYFERYLKETVSNNDELVSFLNEEE